MHGAQVFPACISLEVGYRLLYRLSFWLVLIVPGVHVVLVYPVVICFTLFLLYFDGLFEQVLYIESSIVMLFVFIKLNWLIYIPAYIRGSYKLNKGCGPVRICICRTCDLYS